MNTVLQALSSLGFDWHVALANLFNFFLIFFVLKHFFFASIKETLTNRRSKIEKGLEDADKATVLLENAEQEKKNIIISAEAEAGVKLAQVEKKSLLLSENIQKDAEKKAEDILKDAQRKSVKSAELSMIEIQAKVPAMVADMVERVLKTKMTKEENDRYIKAL